MTGESDAASDRLVPGDDGTPVPAGGTVLRFGPPPSAKHLNDPAHEFLRQHKAWPGLFAFSSAEQLAIQSGKTVRLSVWHCGLTTTAQAWRLVGAKDTTRVVVTLTVDRVREVRVGAGPALDVQWERAVVPDPTDPAGSRPNTQPGADGHCGIANLDSAPKPERDRLRRLLADTVYPDELVVLSDADLAAFRQSTGG